MGHNENFIEHITIHYLSLLSYYDYLLLIIIKVIINQRAFIAKTFYIHLM